MSMIGWIWLYVWHSEQSYSETAAWFNCCLFDHATVTWAITMMSLTCCNVCDWIEMIIDWCNLKSNDKIIYNIAFST